MAESEKTYEVVSPDGRRGTVPASKIQDAYDLGYRPETEDERRQRKAQAYGDQSGLAAGAGALRGATLGISDAALTTFADDPKAAAQKLAALREYSPVASTLGEVGGAVASSLLLPSASPAGLVGKVGQAVEKRAATALGEAGVESIGRKLAATALSKGAGSAVEGAFYGAGNLLTEQALGDEELTAEKVIANVGLGAVLGGALGGAMGAGGVLVKEGVSKASSMLGETGIAGKAEEYLTGLANESAIKATGARGSDIRKLGTDAKITQLGEDIRSFTLKDGRKLLEAGDDSGALLAKLRSARSEVGQELGALRRAVDKGVRDNPELALDVGAYLGRVREEVLEPLQKSGVPSVRALGKNVYKELSAIQKAYEKGHEFAPSELEQFRKDLAKVAYPQKPAMGGIPAPTAPHGIELQKAERILSDMLEKNANEVADKLGGPGQEYARLRRLNESFIKASDMADKATKQDLGNRRISPTDYLTGIGAGVGGAIAGGPVGVVAGLAAAAGHLVVRERGRSVVAVMAEKAAGLMAAEKAGQAVTKRITGAVDGFFSRTSEAVRRIPAPASTSVLSEARFAGRQQHTTEVHRQAVADSESGRSGRLQHYRKRLDELTQIAGNPMASAERLSASTHGLGMAAPTVAGHVQTKAAQAASFLLAKAPKPPASPNSLNPFARKWEPSDIDLAKWERYAAAASDPLSVVDELKHGTISREGVEALKTLYPKLYEEVATKLTARAVEHKADIPYRDRLALGILLGTPTDESLSPSFLRTVQGQYAATAPTQEEAKAQGIVKPTAGGLGKLNLSDSATTKTQRIADR
jgi:hypothetical protein